MFFNAFPTKSSWWITFEDKDFAADDGDGVVVGVARVGLGRRRRRRAGRSLRRSGHERLLGGRRGFGRRLRFGGRRRRRRRPGRRRSDRHARPLVPPPFTHIHKNGCERRRKRDGRRRTVDGLDADDVVVAERVVVRSRLVVGEHDGALDRRVRQAQRVAKLVHGHRVKAQTCAPKNAQLKIIAGHKPNEDWNPFQLNSVQSRESAP